MSLMPAVDPKQIMFETQLIEQAPPEAERKGLHVGNRITCAAPRAIDVVEWYGAKLPPDIKTQTNDSEFWLVRLGWTLHPDEHAALSWVEFRVELGYYTFIPQNAPNVLHPFKDDIVPVAHGTGTPLAYNLYPLNVSDERQVEHTVKLSPSLTFDKVSVSLGEDVLGLKYTEMSPKITAYGKGEAQFYWRFLPGTGDRVTEGVKELDAIIQKKRDTIVGGRIRFKGVGQKWGILPDAEEPNAQIFYV